MIFDRLLFKKDIYVVTTNKCSFDCEHCCWDKNNRRLSIDELKKIIEFAENYECSISFGGGEILTLNDEYLNELNNLMSSYPSVPKTIFSTLSMNLDPLRVSLLEKADKIMFSLDSYRLSSSLFDIKLVSKNALKLNNPEKVVSYTPKIDDTKANLEFFYKVAVDSGAKVFYFGFLYPSKKVALIPAEKYLELIDELLNINYKLGGLEIALFSKTAVKPNENFGFRAFDCFKSGVFISPTGIVNSCPVIDNSFKSKYPVPETELEQFLKYPQVFYADNLRFMRNCFIKQLNKKCLDCVYYSFCMGGCPYFRCFSQDNIDIYCEVYKRIFEYYFIKHAE